MAAGTGPTYNLGAQILKCLGQLKDIGVWAVGAATFIVKNAGQFSSVIARAASSFLGKWQGVSLGPVAAATAFGVEFLAAAIATLTVTQWLLIAGAIAVGAVSFFELWACWEGFGGG